MEGNTLTSHSWQGIIDVASILLTKNNSLWYNENKNSSEERNNMDPQLLDLSTRLAEVAVKNTASTIASKIRAVKSNKDDKRIIAEMNDIIYELLEEKQELELIAKAYQEEFVSQKLKDEDLEYISSTVIPVLKSFMEKWAETQEGNERKKTLKFIESIDAFESLISLNTLNVLQLLGFNFKKGIGEPMTEALKKSIDGTNKKEQSRYNELILEREVEYFKLIQDEEAFARFMSLR